MESVNQEVNKPNNSYVEDYLRCACALQNTNILQTLLNSVREFQSKNVDISLINQHFLKSLIEMNVSILKTFKIDPDQFCEVVKENAKK